MVSLRSDLMAVSGSLSVQVALASQISVSLLLWIPQYSSPWLTKSVTQLPALLDPLQRFSTRTLFTESLANESEKK